MTRFIQYGRIRLHNNSAASQRGAALLIFFILLSIGLLALFVSNIGAHNLKLERDAVTAKALADAKIALIGFAVSGPLTNICLASSNCPRPGDLPCPDLHNLGDPNAGTPTTPCSGNVIGRLPWKTLGLPDLRDASGERLWYVVSSNFSNSPRIFPLNSDTTGTLTVSEADGAISHDATNQTGAIAVILAPGSPLTRQDGFIQTRNPAGYNSPANYLDVAPSISPYLPTPEDNASFANSTVNGFINGEIKVNGAVVLNDRLITVSKGELMPLIEKRVAKEVVHALNDYFCGVGNATTAGNCIAAGGNRFYPTPADFNNNTCLGTGAIPANCQSGAANRGRIPANPAVSWDALSILRGAAGSQPKWFRANAWREQVYYAVAPACVDGTSNCNGAGYLTLLNPPAPPLNAERFVLVVSGQLLPGQSRALASDKSVEANYLEDENLTPLDDTYTRHPANSATPFNDTVLGIP